MKRSLLLLVTMAATANLYAQQWLGASNATGNLYRSGNVGIGNITVPQGLLHVSSGNSGDAELLIEADVDNNNENDNPYITFRQDNGGAMGFIGLVGDPNLAPQNTKYPRWFQNPDGTWSSSFDYPGTISNYLLLSVNDQKGIQFGTFGFVRVTVRDDGNVGIGTNLSNNPNGYRLAVNGKIGAKEVQVENTSSAWADYVFEKDYPLMSLSQLQSFIHQHKHLPEIPSAEEVKANGHKLGEMDVLLLKKVEELTLYILEQEKRILKLEQQLERTK